MSEAAITVRSSTRFVTVTTMGLILVPLLGAVVSRPFLPTTQWDWMSFLGVYFGIPASFAAVAYLLGWKAKKLACCYTPPEWRFEPVQMTIEDAEDLPRTYNRQYRALVANSNFWMFFLPVLIVIYLTGLPVYVFTTGSSLANYIEVLYAIPLGLLFLSAIAGAYLATSNAASDDFTLPLIREAVKLAKTQAQVPGVAQVRVAMDRAEHNSFRIYADPRVILRIQGLEKQAYVESWSGEVGAIWKMLCRLYESEDGRPQTVWWWVSHDRRFRKYTHPDEQGYYVTFPVRSNIAEPGVKDVELVTRNAVAIVVREWLHNRGPDEELNKLMNQLDAEVE
ncbi:hypothetical protein EU545_05850 [Candidatus Thorarchaeota archaeon]|nr:MAG: hypothetical protein EU545_05850 [Candidatus Thorarchaeota archaeon]